MPVLNKSRHYFVHTVIRRGSSSPLLQWKEHLAGKPYHISALYVVDLDRFRATSAGDRLRGQYQGLSSDPNSLANLDQVCPSLLYFLYRYGY